MNVQILPEIAAQVSAHCARLERHLAQVPVQAIHAWWSISRGLFHGWSRELQQSARQLPLLPMTKLTPAWDRVRETIEVSFLTEMLTRVWGTVLLNAGAQHGQQELNRFVQSVTMAARETRSHSLKFLLSQELAGRIDQAGLDRFRRRTERWTDLMLAPVVDLGGNGSLAFAERRVRAFAANHRQTRDNRSGEAAWKLLLAGFRLALPPQTYQHIDRAPILALGQSVLACFPNEVEAGKSISDDTVPPVPTGNQSSVKLVPLRPANEPTVRSRNLYLPPGGE